MAETPESTVRELLQAERDCCLRLLPILEAERAAVACCDVQALLACLRERETVQAEWQRVAEERRQHVRAAAGELLTLAQMDSWQYQLEVGPTEMSRISLARVVPPSWWMSTTGRG